MSSCWDSSAWSFPEFGKIPLPLFHVDRLVMVTLHIDHARYWGNVHTIQNTSWYFTVTAWHWQSSDLPPSGRSATCVSSQCAFGDDQKSAGFSYQPTFLSLASESQLRVWIKPIWPLFFRWVCLQAKGSKIGLVSLIFIFILRLSCLIIIVALIDRCGKLIRQVFDREGFLRNRCYWGLVSKIYGCIPSNYPSSLTSCIWPSVDSSHNPNLSKASPRK